VTAADIDQLRGGWERQMGRPAQPHAELALSRLTPIDQMFN
jgi:hypothetical protein